MFIFSGGDDFAHSQRNGERHASLNGEKSFLDLLYSPAKVRVVVR